MIEKKLSDLKPSMKGEEETITYTYEILDPDGGWEDGGEEASLEAIERSAARSLQAYEKGHYAIIREVRPITKIVY